MPSTPEGSAARRRACASSAERFAGRWSASGIRFRTQEIDWWCMREGYTRRTDLAPALEASESLRLLPAPTACSSQHRASPAPPRSRSRPCRAIEDRSRATKGRSRLLKDRNRATEDRSRATEDRNRATWDRSREIQDRSGSPKTEVEPPKTEAPSLPRNVAPMPPPPHIPPPPSRRARPGAAGPA